MALLLGAAFLALALLVGATSCGALLAPSACGLGEACLAVALPLGAAFLALALFVGATSCGALLALSACGLGEACLAVALLFEAPAFDELRFLRVLILSPYS